MKKAILSFFAILTSFILFSCSGTLGVSNLGIIHELEFGGVYLKITIDDFNQMGFSYGDSVNVEFSNGYKVLDIPYYNGYYVDAGETLLVGYPGYDYVKLSLNYGDDYWFIANLKEEDLGSIYLNQKEKYLDIQNTMNIQYKDERNLYTSDSEFANYREIHTGNIKNNILYRSASPCDNKHKRAPYVDSLMANDHISFIVNLADTIEKIEGYIAKDDFNSPYFLSLYKKQAFLLTASPNEKVLPLAMNMNYKSDEFREKVADGFKQMISNSGPYLIHCQEGKDRTGFVCIVIEALLNSTYEEIVDDYMLTYKNYYGITKEKDFLRYNIIKERNVDTMLRFLANDPNAKLENMNFSSYIKTYLMNGGMSQEEVDSFVKLLS